MKILVLSTIVLAGLTTSAVATDMAEKAPKTEAGPSPWDIAFGAAVMNDYIFRGITQSNHRASVAAYFEPRYNVTKSLQLYAGISSQSISFPNRAVAEVDFYGGIRPTFGPVALDFGFWYYAYPGGQEFSAANPLPNGNLIKGDLSFWEVYGKASWTVVNPFVLGLSIYYSPSFLNSGASGTYLSGTAKYTFPALSSGIGFYISGEFGRQWLGTTDAFYSSIKYANYDTWNIGAGAIYKVFTLDLRYSDTNLSRGDCNAFTSDFTSPATGPYVTSINPLGGGSNWCGPAFIAKLSVDLTLDSLK